MDLLSDEDDESPAKHDEDEDLGSVDEDLFKSYDILNFVFASSCLLMYSGGRTGRQPLFEK